MRKVLAENEINVTGYLIDGSEISMLNGIEALSRDEIRKKYGKVDIVIGHARYELESEIKKEDFVSSVVCITDVCYGQWKKTTYQELEERISDYVDFAEHLVDEKSVECLKAFLACKLSGKWQDIFPVVSKDSYFINDFFTAKNETFLDLGAYIGDTIKEYVSVDSEYKQIYAFEPEEDSFEQLEKYVHNQGLKRISLFKMGGWNECKKLTFNETDESSSITEGDSDSYIQVDRMDSILQDVPISLIKINYYVGVSETLEGCEGLLRKYKPRIVITAGFDAFSVLKYEKIISKINPSYKFSLRFGAAMPARLFLYAY